MVVNHTPSVYPDADKEPFCACLRQEEASD